MDKNRVCLSTAASNRISFQQKNSIKCPNNEYVRGDACVCVCVGKKGAQYSNMRVPKWESVGGESAVAFLVSFLPSFLPPLVGLPSGLVWYNVHVTSNLESSSSGLSTSSCHGYQMAFHCQFWHSWSFWKPPSPFFRCLFSLMYRLFI